LTGKERLIRQCPEDPHEPIHKADFDFECFVAAVFRMFAPKLSAQGTNAPLLTRVYKVDALRFYQLLTNGFPDSLIDHSPPPQGLVFHTGPSFENLALPKAVRQWLASIQVPLSQSNEASFFNDRLGLLLVRATEEEQDTVMAALIKNHL